QLSNSKAELENLQAQKDELFALIIHDIKNPAALIKSLVDLLRSYDLSAVEKQEIIDDIAETTARIVSLSQEVTKILALETTKLELNIETVQIGDIVEDVVNRNFVSAKSKNIEMTYDVSKNLPEIEIDAQKIDEVLDNLISNAIKFTQKGGKVHVRSYLDENKVIVEVNDNGLGLTEDDIKRAFQRGKLSAQPTGGESSTGLGLWIVKKLVDAHNGRVWVKSTLGKGSSFAFSLPLRQKKEEVTA
ncbi:MAG TPA: HAMP domain-containing sensor histidine kinase, partial [Candidatus Kapabacteria bacterium]|nr:HAMP domain-containing sensor histidine kinase [Candidatus Kapabacteria bacterium]